MLKLFQTFFGAGETQGRYPAPLIEMAIERAVDGTDPRLRAVSGYRKQLREPVIRAIDHVIALVDALPAPLAAERAAYSTDPRLAALFVSADDMLATFADDATLRGFRHQPTGGTERVFALLMAERVEKQVLGMELAGETLRRDVLQVAVNFGNHRLRDPSAHEAQTRRYLKRRAFDHLLTLALAHIVDRDGERAELSRQRDLLRHKLHTLQKGGWSFEHEPGTPPDPATLSRDLEDIEGRLQQLGRPTHVLKSHLEVVIESLSTAPQQLWSEAVTLNLDRMNIMREAQDTSAQPVVLEEIHNARGERLVLLLISLVLGELPQREDFIAAAQRYL